MNHDVPTPNSLPESGTGTVQDFSEWGDAVASNLLPFRVTSDSPGGFRGLLRTRMFADIGLTDVRSGPHEAHRTAAMIVRNERPDYLVSLQLSGSATVEQDGRQATVGPGDFSFYDTTKPVSIKSGADYRSVAIRFPQSRMTLPAEYVGKLTATCIPAQSGLAPATGALLSKLNDSLDSVSQRTQDKAVQHAFDFVQAMLEGELDRRSLAPTDPKRDLMEQVNNYIEDHLSDPELGPAQIAAAHFISQRHLHNLYEGTGWTVSASIRSRRLDHCREELSDPFQSKKPIASIAARWGFKTASHFGHVFKEATGLTPAEFRRQQCYG